MCWEPEVFEGRPFTRTFQMLQSVRKAQSSGSCNARRGSGEKVRRCKRLKAPPAPKVRFEGRFGRIKQSPHGRRRARTDSCATASVRSGDAYNSAFRTCRVGKTREKASESENDRTRGFRKPKFAAGFERAKKAKGRRGRPSASFGDLLRPFASKSSFGLPDGSRKAPNRSPPSISS